MKPTPTEAAALAAARQIKPLPVEEFNRLAAHPAVDSFAWRHIRHKLALSRLAWAAEKWEERERRNYLYRAALARRYKSGLIGDAARWDITHYRVTALDEPTRRIRDGLVYAYRRALETEAEAWRLF
jgi:hypothetical protein